MRLDDHSHHSAQSLTSVAESKRTKRKGRRLDDQHSHQKTETLASASEGKRVKRKGRRKSAGGKERGKSSRSSSLSGRSGHSQNSDDTSTRHRRRATDRERRRRDPMVSSSPPGGNKRRRKGLSKNHSVSDLRGLQHTDGSLQRSLDPHGYRRSNSSPDLKLQWTNRRVVGEPQSPNNFDWADQVGTIRPFGSTVSKMEDGERLIALERLNNDIMVRISMLELKHENNMLKTRIERMEEGDIVVKKHREYIVSSNEEPEYVNDKGNGSKTTTTKRLPRSTLNEESSGLTMGAQENNCFYFCNKSNIAIVIGLLLAAAGGVAGIIHVLLSNTSNNDAVYQPLTDDAPIFESTIFPAWTENDGM